MKTKKIIALILAAVMCVCALAACGDNNNDSADSDNSENTSNNVSGADTAQSDDSAQSGSGDLAKITSAGKLVIGITEYEPMNYRDENGNWTGFDTEYAEAVCKELGVTAEFLPIEWDNKIFELNSKAIDCVWNGMTLTEEVTSAMDCTDPYIKNAQVVVMKADKLASYPDTASMKNLTFAAESGSAGEAALKEANLSCTAVTAQSDALLEVKSGSVDACVIDITMAKAMTGEGTSYADLGFAVEITSENYGIGFRKGSDLAAKVNEITKKLTDSGFMDTLGEKYGLKDNLSANLAD